MFPVLKVDVHCKHRSGWCMNRNPCEPKAQTAQKYWVFFTLGSVMSQGGDLLIWSSQVHPPACHTLAVVDCQSEETCLKGGGAKSAFFSIKPRG